MNKCNRWIMKGFLFCLFSVLSLSSCKAKKAVVTEGNAVNTITDDKIIDNHYGLKKDFKTLYIKADVSYRSEKQSQNVTAEIKIQKDQKILVSIRFLGITMAKALITPKEVMYYEKIGGKYFEGDYTTLSKWLGTDLDFYKMQNMIVGEALDNLKKGKYKVSIEEDLYKLVDNSNTGTQKAFFFEAAKFLIKKQEISQSSKDRKLIVTYPSHKEYPEAFLPTQLLIEAFQKDGKTSINIDYKNASFNEEMTFPYSAPQGYEKININ